MHISLNIFFNVLIVLSQYHQRSSRESICYDQIFLQYIDDVKIELYPNRQFLQMFRARQRNQWYVVRFDTEILDQPESLKVFTSPSES